MVKLSDYPKIFGRVQSKNYLRIVREIVNDE